MMESKDDRNAESGLKSSSNDGTETPCSCGSACCGSGGPRDSGKRGMFSVKTVIFIAVVCAAIAVAAWSLIKAGRGSAAVTAQGLQAGALSREEANATTSGPLLGLAEVAPGKDFAFVLLSGGDPNQTAITAQIIEQASQLLREKGVQVAGLTVTRDDPLFQKLAGATAADKLPAVILIGRNCGPSVMTGEITVDTLLRGYVRVACSSGCGPGACGADAAKSGCCVGK